VGACYTSGSGGGLGWYLNVLRVTILRTPPEIVHFLGRELLRETWIVRYAQFEERFAGFVWPLSAMESAVTRLPRFLLSGSRDRMYPD
jgi:hypothetical protein